MADNNDAFNALLRQQQGGGSTNPHLTGGAGAIAVVAGLAPTDTRGLLSDTAGIADGNKVMPGLGSLFRNDKAGKGKFGQMLDREHGNLAEIAQKMNEHLKQVSAGALSGSGAGGIDAPLPTPAPVASNDRGSSGNTRTA